MRKGTFATIAAADLAAVSIGLAAPGMAAPAGSGTAQDVVDSLKADGYTVIVNKVGNAALSDCTVSATKPGHTYTRTDSGAPGDNDSITVTAKTIIVYVSC